MPSPASYRDIKFGNEARKAIASGINQAVDAIKLTLGYTGKAVMIENPLDSFENPQPPIVSDDGIFVAKAVLLKDKFENLGAQMIFAACNRTNETGGDGTSTTAVLVKAIVDQAIELLDTDKSVNPTQLKEEMKAGVDKVIAELTKMKKDCTPEDIEKVATVASLDTEIGKLIAEVFKEVGKDGVVTLEQTQKPGIEKEVVPGMRFNQGYITQYMGNEPFKRRGLLQAPVIFITDEKLLNVDDVQPILATCGKTANFNLLIVCADMDNEALKLVLRNEYFLNPPPGGQPGRMNTIAVRAPYIGQQQQEFLEDLATLTGATVFSKKKNMTWVKEGGENISDKEWFGHAVKVEVNQTHTTIVEGRGDKEAIYKRSESVREILNNPELDKYDKEYHERRIAYFLGSIATIKVGAYTESELSTKLFKVEDALNASKAAVKEGILPGGGTALAKVGHNLASIKNANTKGEGIIYDSLISPLAQMAENRGMEVSETLNVLDSKDFWQGYNFKTKQLVDLYDDGIIDSFKITRAALENAYSIASTVLSTDAALVAVHEKKGGDDNAV